MCIGDDAQILIPENITVNLGHLQILQILVNWNSFEQRALYFLNDLMILCLLNFTTGERGSLQTGTFQVLQHSTEEENAAVSSRQLAGRRIRTRDHSRSAIWQKYCWHTKGADSICQIWFSCPVYLPLCLAICKLQSWTRLRSVFCPPKQILVAWRGPSPVAPEDVGFSCGVDFSIVAES
jgi:hypothetical protein